ncbi:MAG: hypothetical protein OXJ37_01625 [Bryobacterales bacterium]|nr:hypothetical protein [Bryobacterales bacterium]MDE0623546.1 hypothetical protein [Bryobacterales bacterium]
MTNFRILYLTADAGERFRERSPRKPPFVLRRSHYESGPELTAEGPYELWRRLREQSDGGEPGSPRPIEVGDALETADGVLLCNFWGFDAAQWMDADEPEGHGAAAENGAP